MTYFTHLVVPPSNACVPYNTSNVFVIKIVYKYSTLCTFMNCGNLEEDTFVSDVVMSKLGSLLSVTCRHCSVRSLHGMSLQQVPIR